MNKFTTDGVKVAKYENPNQPEFEDILLNRSLLGDSP